MAILLESGDPNNEKFVNPIILQKFTSPAVLNKLNKYLEGQRKSSLLQVFERRIFKIWRKMD